MHTGTLLLSPVVGRRTSYQEVVHRECRPSHPSNSCPVTLLASCLAEWLVVLQKVAEDRGPEQPSVSCQCEKASRLCKEIQSLCRRVSEGGQVWQLAMAKRVHHGFNVFSCSSLFQLAEKVGGQLPPSMLEGFGSDIAKVAHTLRYRHTIIVPKLSWSCKLSNCYRITFSKMNTFRSEVSILVPNGVGSAEPEVAEAARWLLGDGDLRLGF